MLLYIFFTYCMYVEPIYGNEEGRGTCVGRGKYFRLIFRSNILFEKDKHANFIQRRTER